MFEPVYFSNNCPELAPILIVLIIFFTTFCALVVTVIKVLIFCKVFSKAGYSWALGLLMLVPIANIIMAFFLAFADWPVCRELRKLKQQLEKSQT
jgi:uncharacterized membrane protein YhaH (DUF805 family)